jgi:hypothetical protein
MVVCVDLEAVLSELHPAGACCGGVVVGLPRGLD